MINTRSRILFAAPASGDGKTTFVTGFLQALLDRGLRPAAFKCGPDYIDPMFHREVLGINGGNLDLFFTPPEIVRGLLCHGSVDADLSVIEGVMGYYDGIGASDRAASHHLALETDTPAVLIVRPKGAFLSLAAMINGFLQFRPDSGVRGVILNSCGASLYEKLRPVLENECGIPVYGYLPEMPDARFDSRHLGLTTPDSLGSVRDAIRHIAEQMEKSVDIAGLLRLAETAPSLRASLPQIEAVADTPVRIAVARDEAFCFYYRENLELLRAHGAETVFFSPLRDAGLPDNIGALYLGGGYPELHAAALAANAGMRRDIRDTIARGLPTVAECGGFLYLGSRLADTDGSEHEMVSVLPGTARNTGRMSRFGYIHLTPTLDNLLLAGWESTPAHEFHYWDSEVTGDSCRAEKASGAGGWSCVTANASLFAGFPHLYFWSRPAMAERLVRAAVRWCRR